MGTRGRLGRAGAQATCVNPWRAHGSCPPCGRVLGSPACDGRAGTRAPGATAARGRGRRVRQLCGDTGAGSGRRAGTRCRVRRTCGDTSDARLRMLGTCAAVWPPCLGHGALGFSSRGRGPTNIEKNNPNGACLPCLARRGCKVARAWPLGSRASQEGSAPKGPLRVRPQRPWRHGVRRWSRSCDAPRRRLPT